MKLRFSVFLLLLLTVFTLSFSYSKAQEIQEVPLETPLEEALTLYLPLLQQRDPPVNNFGIEHNSLNDVTGLDYIDQAGADFTRRNVAIWEQVEPSRGQRNWGAVASLDSDLIKVSQRGQKVILAVRESPKWARLYSDIPCGPIKSSEFNSFANFMYDLVKRYSVAPYNVKIYEIWNEPDVAGNTKGPYGCWGDTKDKSYYGGKYYGSMLKTVYPKIKAADPTAFVLIGGLLLDCDPTIPGANCTSSRFLEGILVNGAGNSFDGVSFHAYDYYWQNGQWGNSGWNSSWNTNGTVNSKKVDYLRSLLAKYGFADKPLYNTETALLCYSTCDSQFEISKAYRLAIDYALAITQRLQTNIWYDLYGGWRQTGLVYYNSGPRPSYTAFQVASQMLGKTIYRSAVGSGSVRAYEFQAVGKRVWVIWSGDGATHSFNLPETPLAIKDVFGADLGISNNVNATLSPIYVEFSD